MKNTKSGNGLVLKKRNYFDKLNLFIWFSQLVISFVIALT